MNLLIFSLFIIFIFFYHKKKNLRNRELLSRIPTLSSVPILDHALHFVNKKPDELLEFSLKLANDLGKIAYISILGNPQIITSDPKLSEQILSSTKFIEKSNFYDFFNKWLGTGLLTAGPKKWHDRRKIITPAFHFKILEEFVEIFDKHGQVLVEKLENFEGKEVDIFPFVSLFAMDAICETAMGYDLNAQTISDSDYVKSVKEITKIIFTRLIDPITHSNLIYKFTRTCARENQLVNKLHAFSNDVINRRKDLLKQKSFDDDSGNNNLCGRKLAFLDLLLKSKINGKSLSDEDIREEVDTFMFEGHDTVTSAITFTLLNIAKYSDIQKKIFEECKGILSGKGTASMNDLKQMKFLENVIKESLRLYPSVPFFSRVLNEDLQYDDYLIPAGIPITISPFIMGRREANFENALNFDPSRFDNEVKNHFAYIPFSAGSRNCIGQKFAMLEMKSVLSKIVIKFEIYVNDEHRDPKIMYETILRPVNGVMLNFKKRN